MTPSDKNKTITPKSDNLPLKAVARLVNASPTSIRRWVAKIDFPEPYSLGGRTFFCKKEVDAWIEKQKQSRGFNGTPPCAPKR